MDAFPVPGSAGPTGWPFGVCHFVPIYPGPSHLQLLVEVEEQLLHTILQLLVHTKPQVALFHGAKM
jgi:hypothetical protein